jgi:hypothetical protein
MNLDVQKENAKALASALGIKGEEAMDLLATCVAITHQSTDKAGAELPNTYASWSAGRLPGSSQMAVLRNRWPSNW